MKLLIQDTLLVTMNRQDEVLHGDLLVQDGEIVSVGPRVESASGVERVLDGRGFIAMPGLVNAHSHLADYLFKGVHYDRPLEIWRNYSRVGRRTARERHLYVGALLGSLELLRSGTTTVLEHHYSGLSDQHMGVEHIIRGLRETGMRAAVALIVADQAYEQTIPLDVGALDETARREVERLSTFENPVAFEACQSFIERYRGSSPLLTPMVGPAAPYRCSDRLLLACRELAERYDLGLHLHLLETKVQAVQGQRLYGRSDVARLADMGFLSPRLSAAHCIWLKDDDVPLLAEYGVTAVHNPAANLRLGSGLAPVPTLLREGVTVGLGTDSALANDTQNMFDAIRLAGLIHNLSDADYERWLTPQQVLRMATMGGARACRMGHLVGSLEPGKRADVVLLRRSAPALTPLNDVFGQLVYSENGSSVDTVLVDGQVVLAGGRSTRVDEVALAAEAEALRRELDVEIDRETRRTRALEPALRQMYLDALSQPWTRAMS